MAAFTTSSVRQLYVANAYGGTTAGNVTSAHKTTENELYLKYVDASGKKAKTPLINLSKIRYVKSTKAVAKALRKDSIAFDAPVAGQTYIIRFLMRNWGSGSSENQYFKHVGSYKAKVGDTAETLVDAFIASATKNFAREPIALFTFTKVGAGASATLVVEEVAQPWVLGKQQGRGLDYSIQFVKIVDANGENYQWGTVTRVTNANPGIGTPQIAADQEFFYLGERGDIYRSVGYPYTFDTKYLVDQTKYYDTIDIVYYDDEPHNGGAVQSEKVVTILCLKTGLTNYAVQAAIAGAINTAVGSTLVTVLS